MPRQLPAPSSSTLSPGLPASVAAVACLTLACAALAQSQDNPAAAPTPPLLTGPSVEQAASAPTLIRVGYDGRIQRIEDAQPEVTALELVDLAEDDLARIQARLDERAAFLDRVVTEHYRTLLNLYTAFGAGDQREVIRLYVDFTSHLAPLFEGGGLARQLGSEMPPEARQQYASLLRAYYDAIVEDALAHPEDQRPGAARTRAEVLRNYKIELLLQEVGRSFARIIEQKTGELEDALAALRLTPEREGEIRALVQAHAEEVGLNPTPQQRRDFFRTLMVELTPAERQRLMAWVLR